MKLKYFFPTLIVMLAMLASCEKDDEKTFLDGLRVSKSYVALDSIGTPVKVKVSAAANWAFEKAFTKITDNGDGTKDTTKVETPDWLTIDIVSGPAGDTEITFSGSATTESHDAELKIISGGKAQIINVIQTVSKQELPLSTCADVIAGPESKTYRVKGAVAKIANTTYGNWYLKDETGEVYVYGTLDAKGATKNFLSLGLEVGDIVTVEGPKTVYNGTVELVDVTVVDIEKSLIKVDSLSVNEALPIEGGLVTAYLTNKTGNYSVEIPEDAEDWLIIKTFDEKSMTFRALSNAGGDRSTTVTFKTTQDGKTYTSQVDIAQKGAIVECSIADFLAAPVGDTQYRLTGVITKVAKATYGNVYIADYSGETYVYGIGAKGDFEAAGLKEGDVVTLVGKRAAYMESPQMGGGQLESSISVTQVSIEDFLTKEDSNDTYYMVTGTVDEIANPTYGNLYLKDGDTRLYVYGCYPGWGATGDARKECLATKDIAVGDKLTVIGVKSTYNDTPQLKNGIYFSHEKAGGEE